MWLARARLREMDECVEVRRYQPTDVPRRPARPKRPVWRPKKRCPKATDAQTSSPRPEACQQSDKEEQTASRGVSIVESSPAAGNCSLRASTFGGFSYTRLPHGSIYMVATNSRLEKKGRHLLALEQR